jgi:hypothetical protein
MVNDENTRSGVTQVPEQEIDGKGQISASFSFQEVEIKPRDFEDEEILLSYGEHRFTP